MGAAIVIEAEKAIRKLKTQIKQIFVCCTLVT